MTQDILFKKSPYWLTSEQFCLELRGCCFRWTEKVGPAYEGKKRAKSIRKHCPDCAVCGNMMLGGWATRGPLMQMHEIAVQGWTEYAMGLISFP